MHEQLVNRGFYDAFALSPFWQNTARQLKPSITIFSGSLAEAVVETAEQLAGMPDVFDYGNQAALVQNGGLTVLSQDRLAHELGLRIRYVGFNQYGREVAINPPLNLVKQLLALGKDRSLKRLSGIIDSPVVLADGTLLSLPGYDSRSSSTWLLPRISSQKFHRSRAMLNFPRPLTRSGILSASFHSFRLRLVEECLRPC